MLSGRPHIRNPGAPAAPAATPGLLRDIFFRRYWSAATVSAFGDAVSALAVPLVAVTVLHANPIQIGFLNSLIWAPSLLFSLYAGVWADSMGRRRVTMIALNFCSFLLFLSIPLGQVLGTLSIWQLYGVVFAAGSCSVFFNICDATVFACIVPAGQYVEGQSLIWGSLAMASLGGPFLAGLLLQVISAPLAIAIDAASYLGSALLLARIHPAEPPLPAGRPDRSLATGLLFIWRSRIIRANLSVTATVNFFNVIFQTLLVLYLARDLNAHSGLIGLLLAGQAAGGLIGSALAKFVARRLGVVRVLLIGSVAVSAPLPLVPLASGLSTAWLPMLLLAMLGSGMGRIMQNVSTGAIFAASVPDALRSRVRGAFQMMSIGTRPLGALLAGMLGTLIGLRPTLWLAAVGGVLAFLWLTPPGLLAWHDLE